MIEIGNEINNNELIEKKILLLFSELSERGKNVLNEYLENDHTIDNYLKKIKNNSNFNVFKLRNCGQKTSDELSDYFSKIFDIENIDFKIYEDNKQKEIIKICSDLNETRELIIEKFIKDTFKLLNARSQNALINSLDEINFTQIKDRILFNDHFEISKIRNIGKGTIPYVEKFILNLVDYIFEINQSENIMKKDDLSLKISIESLFSNILLEEDLINQRNHLKIIDLIINSDQLFNKKEKLIFKSNLNFLLEENKLTLKELKKPLSLSKERIRQIRVDILSTLIDNFQFIKMFHEDFLDIYEINENDSFVSLSYELVEKLNNRFDVKFTQQFHTFILSYLLDNSYSLIGHFVDVATLFERVNDLSRHNWNHLFLITNELKSKFDFSSFVNDVYFKINENSSEGYKFHFKSYLSNFLLYDDYKILNNLTPICEEILEREFNIILDLDECIVFERTKAKTLSEYAEEALEIIGKPSHVFEITNYVKKLYPEFSKEISGQNLTNRSIFTFFGRSSIYGLLKWEQEKVNIKGGTIKDFVIEYLKNKDEPIHIFELYEEIIKYRSETYIRSILDNLKAKPGNLKFVFYPLGFIGLKQYEEHYDKKYNSIPIMLTKTIVSKIKNKSFKTKDDIILFLNEKYKLSEIESTNYINYIEFINSPFF